MTDKTIEPIALQHRGKNSLCVPTGEHAVVRKLHVTLSAPAALMLLDLPSMARMKPMMRP
jgi:hypothetical protein